MYAFWDIEPNEQIFLSFRIILCLFTSLTQKIKIQKMKRLLGDIIILHMYTINYMTYGSWDIECDRLIFLSFSTFFALLPP